MKKLNKNTLANYQGGNDCTYIGMTVAAYATSVFGFLIVPLLGDRIVECWNN